MNFDIFVSEQWISLRGIDKIDFTDRISQYSIKLPHPSRHTIMELGKNNVYLRALTPDNLSFRPKRNKDMRKLALTFSYRDFTDFFRVSLSLEWPLCEYSRSMEQEYNIMIASLKWLYLLNLNGFVF